MSASVSDSGTNYLRTTALGYSEVDQLLLGLWFWRSTTHTPSSNQIIAAVSTNTTHPSFGLSYNATPELNGFINATAYSVGDNLASGTFEHFAIHTGPWSNPCTRRVWFNGVETYNTNTSVSNTGTIDRLTLFAGSGGTLMARGKICEVGLVQNPADPAAIVALMQTYSPTVIPGLEHGWRLYNDFVDALGGADFSATGTVSSDTSNHKSLTLTPPAATFIPYAVLV